MQTANSTILGINFQHQCTQTYWHQHHHVPVMTGQFIILKAKGDNIETGNTMLYFVIWYSMGMYCERKMCIIWYLHIKTFFCESNTILVKQKRYVNICHFHIQGETFCCTVHYLWIQSNTLYKDRQNISLSIVSLASQKRFWW